jgi:hypothetical protein
VSDEKMVVHVWGGDVSELDRVRDDLREREEEVDALRALIAGDRKRRDQRTGALLVLGALLMAASCSPPLLVLLGLAAAGAGIVNMIGRK